MQAKHKKYRYSPQVKPNSWTPCEIRVTSWEPSRRTVGRDILDLMILRKKRTIEQRQRLVANEALV